MLHAARHREATARWARSFGGVALVGACGVVLAGCQCRPDPSVPTPADTSEPPTDTARTDTAPPPPCAWPESEPNNSDAEADLLPLEAFACGTFGAPADSDFWSFPVTEDTWLGVRVDAAENGSFANPAVVLSGDDGLAILRNDGSETADVHLLFPTAPRNYTLLVLEESGQGDSNDRWFYDVMATVQKAPIDWTRSEVEPNDTVADVELANPALSGDLVFGVLDDGDDRDLLRIDVPVGRHEITVAAKGFDLGSPADTELLLLDSAGDSPGCGPGNGGCVFRRGAIGFERDPVLTYSSDGAETLYVRVQSEDDRGSAVHWYVLDVRIEGNAEEPPP
jgi:hypothetical protein